MSCFSPLVRLRDRTSGRDHHEEDGWDNGSGCSRHSYARERRARYRRIRRLTEWVAQRDRGRNFGRRDGSGLLTDPQRNGLARPRRGSVTSATPRDLARRCGGRQGRPALQSGRVGRAPTGRELRDCLRRWCLFPRTGTVSLRSPTPSAGGFRDRRTTRTLDYRDEATTRRGRTTLVHGFASAEERRTASRGVVLDLWTGSLAGVGLPRRWTRGTAVRGPRKAPRPPRYVSTLGRGLPTAQ